jgi:type I restriction enzyme, R subunit
VSTFTESDVEQAALAWLEAAGWRIAHGPDIAPDLSACGAQAGMPAAQRTGYGGAVLAPAPAAPVPGRRSAEP